MAGGGGNKKIFQYCTDLSGQEILCLRALQGHSGRKTIDPFTAEQCIDSEQILRVHLSILDVQSICTLSQIQD